MSVDTSYGSLFATKLEKTTCEWQNHSFVSNKYVSQALSQSLQTTKKNFEKQLA